MVKDEAIATATPKKILSLDGGGVRGAITIAFLERIEQMLAARAGAPVRLCDYFDLIGGTSTGAIIAGALSLGFSVTDIRSFYLDLAPRVFRRSWTRLIGIQSVFDSRILKREIISFVGNRTLDSPDIKTFIAVVLKRIDTGSPWIVTNSPRAKYWDDAPDGSYRGNRHYLLADLVRASTAAPHYFAPEAIDITKTTQGIFVDGGVTPYNNPSIALLMAATMPGFGLNWETGERNLHLFSIGTGHFRNRLELKSFRRMTAASLALRALSGMIFDSEAHALTMLQWLGKSHTPWVINSELGDLTDIRRPGPALFTCERYSVELEEDWLSAHLGRSIPRPMLVRLRRMDDPGMMHQAYELGRIAAEQQVRIEHLPD